MASIRGILRMVADRVFLPAPSPYAELETALSEALGGNNRVRCGLAGRYRFQREAKNGRRSYRQRRAAVRALVQACDPEDQLALVGRLDILETARMRGYLQRADDDLPWLLMRIGTLPVRLAVLGKMFEDEGSFYHDIRGLQQLYCLLQDSAPEMRIMLASYQSKIVEMVRDCARHAEPQDYHGPAHKKEYEQVKILCGEILAVLDEYPYRFLRAQLARALEPG